MTLDLFGGRRLLLAGSRLGPFWIAALAVALILLVVLYREERRLVARRAGLFLLSLRLGAGAGRGGRVTTTALGRTTEQNEKLAKVLGLAPGQKLTELSRREVARRLI